MSDATPLLRQGPFLLFLVSRVLSAGAMQVLVVAVGWQLYALTGSALDLGLVGLAQFLPVLLLTLPAGHAADRFPRQFVLAACRLAAAATAVGLALGMSLLLAWRPLGGRAGQKMFAAVLLFGAATVLFGVSASLPLSLATLAVLGAADVVSVVVRQSLVQLGTPDEMRGRVAAVNSLFIGASNQLGEFRAGVSAAVFGPIAAMALGGLATIALTLLWLRLFPALATVDRLEDVVRERR